MPPSTFSTYLAHFSEVLGNATAAELCSAPLIVIVSILLSYQIRKMLANHQTNTRRPILVAAVLPLIGPLLCLLISVTAVTAFRASGVESVILLFTLKLSVAWIVIELVRHMNSKRTAGWFVALIVLPIVILQLFDVWDGTIAALSSITFSIGTVKLNAFQILKGLVAVCVLQWVASSSASLVDSQLGHMHNLRPSNRALINKIFQITMYTIVVLLGMQMVGISLAALSVFGGALGVGLGFGLQKIASNFISGIILLFEKSVEIGDLIELSDGTMGYVRQIYARYTQLEMTTGKEIFIPNEELISQRVISWTHSNTKARIEITVGIGYESDLKKARELMIDAAKQCKGLLPDIEPACYITAFGDSAIQLQLLFWIRDITAGRSEAKSDTMYAIWESFKHHNISIPFPQRELRVVTPDKASAILAEANI